MPGPGAHDVGDASSSATSGAAASNLFSDAVRRLFYADSTMQTLDWTNIMLLFWVFFGLFVYAVGNILSAVFERRQVLSGRTRRGSALSKSCSDLRSDDGARSASPSSVVNGPLGGAGSEAKGDSGSFDDFGPPEPAARKQPSLVPIAAGPDADCVRWINDILVWLYSAGEQCLENVVDIWLVTLNQTLRKLLAKSEVGAKS